MHRPELLKNFSDYLSLHITPCEVVLMQRFCALQRVSWLKALFIIASRAGDGPLWITTAICLLISEGAQAGPAVLTASLAVGLSVIIFMAVKSIIGRPRPYQSWPGLPCLMAAPDKFSFPSGHTMTAFSAWSSLALAMPALTIPFMLIAITIGLSRIFLGLHYPTDVLAGAVLGSGIGLAVNFTAVLLNVL